MTTESSDVTQLRADLDALRGDFARLTDSLKSVTGKGARAGVDAARRHAEQTRAQAEDWMGVLGSHIEERPYGSLLTAFGVGFLLGKLLDRR